MQAKLQKGIKAIPNDSNHLSCEKMGIKMHLKYYFIDVKEVLSLLSLESQKLQHSWCKMQKN